MYSTLTSDSRLPLAAILQHHCPQPSEGRLGQAELYCRGGRAEVPAMVPSPCPGSICTSVLVTLSHAFCRWPCE